MSDVQQLVIFNDPAARRDGPDTSHAAAFSLPPLGALEALILDRFRHGGLNDEELCELMPECFGPTVRTCRSRLVKRGLLVPTHTVRPSSRGRDMRVWRLAP